MDVLPDAYNQQLAFALMSLSAVLSKVESNNEALEVVKEAVKIRRQILAQFGGPALKANLVTSLKALADCLERSGKGDEALVIRSEMEEMK